MNSIIKTGTIFLTILFCVSCTNMKKLDNQAKIYVDDVVPKIIQNWELSELTKHSHKELLNNSTYSQFESQFFLLKKLGTLEDYQKSEGQIIISRTSDGIKIITGNYAANGKFENGLAKVSVKIIKEKNSWSILFFHVDSDSFQNTASAINNQPTEEKCTDKFISKNELELLVNNLIEKDNTVEIRKNIENIFRLAQIYQDEGLNERAIKIYQTGLKSDPTNFEYQIKFCELLIKLNRSKETIKRLINIYNLVEDDRLFEKTKKILSDLKVDLPHLLVPEPANEKIEILLVPLGDVNHQILSELRVVLQNIMGIKVLLSGQTIPLGEPNRIYSEKYISEVFKKISENITSLQKNMLLSGLHLKSEDLSSYSNQSRFIVSYFNKLGVVGEIELQNYNNILDNLGQKGQYNPELITEEMRNIFPFNKSKTIMAYIGVTSQDLYCETCNFLFGHTDGSYGVISYAGFASVNTNEKQNRPRLINRLLKQALSSTNFALGIPRCDTPLCARSYPNSLEEHDAKSEDLCSVCRNRLENLKKNLHSNTTAYEYVCIGNDYIDKGNWEKAFDAYQSATKYDSKYSPAYLGLCNIYRKKGMNEKVLWASSEALKADPKSYQAYHYLGEAYKLQGMNEKAELTYKKALEVASANEAKQDIISIQNSLGVFYLAMDKKKKGIESFSEVLKTDPENALANYFLGIEKYKIKQFEEAISHLEIAANKDPNLESVYTFLGLCYTGIKKHEKAIDYYEMSLKNKPDSHETHYNLALALESLGQMQNAILHFKKSVEIKPSFFQGHYSLGVIYGKSNLLDSSVRSFETAIALQPDNADAVNNLGYTYFLKKMPAEAIIQYKKALTISPNHVLANYNIAMAYYVLRQFPNAIKYYDNAVRLNYPGSPKFRAALEPYRQ
ncbi:MAG: tetratricopeptide repeat protein [Pseudomonadota bacterium]